MVPSRLAAIGAAFAALLVTENARATCPAAEERLVFLDETLTAEASRARTWVVGWTIGLGTLTAAQLTAVFLAVPEERVDWGVGAAFSAGGTLPLILFPPGVIADAKYIHTLQAGPWDRCGVLTAAERALETGARDEAELRSVLSHAVNVAYNGAQLLVMGAAFGHWEAGAINAAIGLAIGEGLIFTSPNNLGEALAAYRKGLFHAPSKPAPSLALAIKPMAVPAGAGVGVGFRF